MKTRFTVAVLMAAGLTLSACSNEATSLPGTSPSASPTTTVLDRQAGKVEITRRPNDYGVRPVAVQNELRPSWDSKGIPITWTVSEVDNHDWAGEVRPDHAPPNGFQGLEHEAFSGAYRVPLKWNTKGFEIRFVLTPATTIDGERVVLPPITFTGYASAGTQWYMAVEDTRIQCNDGEQSSYPVMTWPNTPRGRIGITYDLVCSKDLATVALYTY